MKKTYQEILFNNREEWKKARRIGGSDLATIMGEGKWQTISDIYTRLVYPERAKSNNLDNNPRVQEGARAEEHIRNLFALEHPNIKVINPPSENWLFVRNDNEFITVSPDGILDDYTGALEIKDIEIYSNKQLESWKSGDIPKQYFYQIMQYFIVLNTVKDIYLVARIKVMNSGELDHVEEYTYHFDRDNFKEEIKKCLQIEKAFIKKYVITQTRPNANYLEEIKKEMKL